ncbi:MAG: TonB-dependent receptor [Saprospiraceae bacterium]|nr:TonB-dependent receptor [Saprospiraceae bacterium]
MKQWLLLFWLCLPVWAFAQTDTIEVIPLERVVIQEIPNHISRVNHEPLNLPYMVASILQKEFSDLQAQQSLQEALNIIPGVFSQNTTNAAQDLRISIRGFGSRSPFGIRGIKLIVDGIPETTPDGQGQVDNLNLGLIQNVVVTTGPASSLYGNASGGVININTQKTFSKPYVEFASNFGEYGFQQYQGQTGFLIDSTAITIHGNYFLNDGYRNHSGSENQQFNINGLHAFSPSSKLNVLFNYSNSPEANDPGGINLEDWTANPASARQQNIDFNAGEAIQQWKAGVTHVKEFGLIGLRSYGFFAQRHFEGFLPFTTGGVVDLERNYGGLGSSLNWTTTSENWFNQLQVGFDAAIQSDDRSRFQNETGSVGALTFQQEESFNNFALYALNYWSKRNWAITAGIRSDWNRLEAEDQFFDNGDSSGRVDFNSFNPSIGLVYTANNAIRLRSNFSTNFETPTLSELSTNPDNNNGFNSMLKPQTARSIEFGGDFEKNMSNHYLNFNLTAYHIQTENDIVPFEIDQFPGRTFFRNSGQSKRQGIESLLTWATSNFVTAFSYTFSDLTYSDYVLDDEDLSGNRLPGHPQHQGSWLARYNAPKGWQVQAEALAVGERYADDQNQVLVNGHEIVNLSLGYEKAFANWSIKPSLGVRNVLNQSYFDNVRINAFGGRYFEAAPERNLFGGLRFKF